MSLPATKTAAALLPRTRSRWLTLGGMSMLDQGLFAGASFVVSILLARWLTPVEFGTFALAFAALSLFVTVHSAAVTEPMGVFGARDHGEVFRRYLDLLLVGQACLFAGASLLAVGAGLVFDALGERSAALAFYCLAAATPAILLLWFARRAHYPRFTQHWAAIGSGAYGVIVVAAVILLERGEALSPATAMLAAGGGSLVVAAILVIRLRAGLPTPTGVLSWRQVASQHLEYARWGVAASLTIWVSAYIQYVVLVPVGFGEAGAMRALDTVLAPYHQYLAAMSVFLLPALAVRLGGAAGASRFLRLATAVLLIQALAVCALLFVAGPALMSLLFGETYAAYDHLLGPYSLMLIPETLAVLLMTVWRARVQTKRVFAYSAVFAGSQLIAVAVAAPWGVTGVIVARLVVSFIAVAAAVVHTLRMEPILSEGQA